MLIRQYGDTDFVIGLRAIAAFMVVSIHTGAFTDLGWIGETINGNGKYGVQIFFVISGYTIAVTYRSAATYGAYFTRRFFRIAPLYYLLCALVFALMMAGALGPNYWMTLYGSAPDTYNALMHLSFLSAWDARLAATVIGPEWTIPIEIFWYLLLPLLLPFTRTRADFLKAFFGLLVLSVVTRGIGEWLLPAHAAHFLPTSYGAYFLLGAACLPLRELFGSRPEHSRQLATGGVVLFIFAQVTDTGLSTAFLALATAMMIVGIRIRPGGWHLLTWRPMLFLGSISYSIYLWHYIAIRLLEAHLPDLYAGGGLWRFVLVSVLTVAASTVTYELIEKPTNRLGRSLAQS